MNIWKIIYLNCGETHEDILIITVMHTTRAVVKLKPEKNSDLNGIQTHDLCNTGSVLYQLSYQANYNLLDTTTA